jgi:hypothetical protein
MGVLLAPRLGGLLIIPSSTLSFTKSTAAKAAPVAKYIK